MLVELTKRQIELLRKPLHETIMEQRVGLYTEYNQLAMILDEAVEEIDS